MFHHAPRQPRGFSFIEVLFAILILGIGFLLIAAMLPVAIKQTQATRNDVAGRSALDGAFAALKATAGQTEFADPSAPPDVVFSDAQPTGTYAGHAGPTFGGGTNDTFARRNFRYDPQHLAGDYSQQRFVYLKPDPLDELVGEDDGNPDNDLYGRYSASVASTVGSRVSRDDPRLMWYAFVGRRFDAAGSPYTQLSPRVSLVTVAVRREDLAFTLTAANPRVDDGAGDGDGDGTPNEVLPVLNRDNGPILVEVQVTELDEPGPAPLTLVKTEPDRLRFPNWGSDRSDLVAAPGAFVVVATHDRAPPTAPASDPDVSADHEGRVFRLARQLLDIDVAGSVWELEPGYDLPLLRNNGNTVKVSDDTTAPFDDTYVVDRGLLGTGGTNPRAFLVGGRGLNNPFLRYDATTNPYAGPAQGVAVVGGRQGESANLEGTLFLRPPTPAP